MDPITVLSVASSVVAFVDFGGKLLNRVIEIKRSTTGQPQDAADILQCSTELTAIATEAREKVMGLEARHPRHAKLIERINVDCIQIEQQLTRVLETLTVKDSNTSSGIARLGSQAKVAIRSVLSNRQLQELASKLDGIRNQVMISMMMCLLDDVQETQKHAKISGDGSQVIIETLARVESKLDEIHSRSTTDPAFGTGHIPKEPMIDALWTWSELLDFPGQVASPFTSTSRTPETNEAFAQKVLKSLKYDGMVSRSDAIDDAFTDTFGWLFNPEQDSGTNRIASEIFTDWLESESERAFWITGKPASGKSTLMKFIATHPSLLRHLRKWAAEQDLLVAHFYFWGPGTDMQKTWVGLLRSLLHQLLSKRPSLCGEVAIRRHTLFSMAGLENKSPEWTFSELQGCLLRLASSIQGNSRLALFIDGLDEFEGHHKHLISFFKRLQHDYKVKICVSSRPWVVFSDAFRQNPSLRMEDLTKSDIDKYITERFIQCIALQEVEALHPESIQSLKKSIADRAEGVFLWVVIVVEQIVMKATETPVIDEIWAIFDSLPPEIGALYKRIHDGMDPQMRESSSRMYRIVLAWKLQIDNLLDAVHFWVAFNHKDNNVPVSFPDPGSRHSIISLVRRLLAGHTKGILHASSTLTIDFIHRTAFDWLLLPEQVQDLRKHSDGFEPLLSLMAVSAGYIRYLSNLGAAGRSTTDSERIEWQLFFHICSRVDPSSVSEETVMAIVNQFRFLEPYEQHLPHELLHLIYPFKWRFDESILISLDTMGSIFSCRAYIYGRIRLDKNYLKRRPHLLDAAGLRIRWTTAGCTEANLDLILNTMSLLTDHGAKVSRKLRQYLWFDVRRFIREIPVEDSRGSQEREVHYRGIVENIIHNRQGRAGNNKKPVLLRLLFGLRRKSLVTGRGSQAAEHNPHSP